MGSFRRLQLEEVRQICKDDPVRPYIEPEWRVNNNLKGMFEYKEGSKVSYMCYAMCADVPESDFDLFLMSREHLVDHDPTVAVFYTIWSNDGIGWKAIKSLPEYIKQEHPQAKRFVTLSPLTAMATNFHMRNGAKCLNIGKKCQNFEYVVNL